VIASMAGHIVFMVISYVAVILWAQSMAWYNSPSVLLNGWVSFVLTPKVFHSPHFAFLSQGTTQSLTQLVTIVFLFGNFFYVDFALAYSIGHPFRNPFWWNPALTVAIVGAISCNIGWYWTTDAAVQSFWSIVRLPVSYLAPLFGVIVVVGVLLYGWEVFVIRVLQPRDIKMQ
jgi:hypothetical protein